LVDKCAKIKGWLSVPVIGKIFYEILRSFAENEVKQQVIPMTLNAILTQIEYEVENPTSDLREFYQWQRELDSLPDTECDDLPDSEITSENSMGGEHPSLKIYDDNFNYLVAGEHAKINNWFIVSVPVIGKTFYEIFMFVFKKSLRWLVRPMVENAIRVQIECGVENPTLDLREFDEWQAKLWRAKLYNLHEDTPEAGRTQRDTSEIT